MKKMLIMLHQPPYRNSQTLELLETAMVGAVFDFEVALLFRAEGVWGLLAQQDAGALGRRTVGKVLSALPTYEVENIFVCSEAMQAAQLQPGQLILPAKILQPQAQAQLIADHDLVVGA